jgi:DNA polymerase III epsilon subunit-like protein
MADSTKPPINKKESQKRVVLSSIDVPFLDKDNKAELKHLFESESKLFTIKSNPLININPSNALCKIKDAFMQCYLQELVKHAIRIHMKISFNPIESFTNYPHHTTCDYEKKLYGYRQFMYGKFSMSCHWKNHQKLQNRVRATYSTILKNAVEKTYPLPDVQTMTYLLQPWCLIFQESKTVDELYYPLFTIMHLWYYGTFPNHSISDIFEDILSPLQLFLDSIFKHIQKNPSKNNNMKNYSLTWKFPLFPLEGKVDFWFKMPNRSSSHSYLPGFIIYDFSSQSIMINLLLALYSINKGFYAPDGALRKHLQFEAVLFFMSDYYFHHVSLTMEGPKFLTLLNLLLETKVYPFQRFTPLEIVFDLETNGFPYWERSTGKKKQPEILQITLREFMTGMPICNKYVNPGVYLKPDAVAVHGITERKLLGKPNIQAIAIWLQRRMQYMSVLTMWAHNVAFDSAVIQYYNVLPKKAAISYICTIPHLKMAVYGNKKEKFELEKKRNKGVLKLGYLYFKTFGKTFANQHTSSADVDALIQLMRYYAIHP